MRRILSIWVLHSFMNEQMNDHVTACQENLRLVKDIFDLLDYVITCDKGWVHYFDPKLKQESSHWKSPHHGSP